MSGPKYGQILIGKIRRAKLMKELDTALEKRECKAFISKQNALQQRFDKFFEEHPLTATKNALSEAEKAGCENSPQYKRLFVHLARLESLSRYKCSVEGDSKALAEHRKNSIEKFFEAGNLWDIINEETSALKKYTERAKKLADEKASEYNISEELVLTSEKVDILYGNIIEELMTSSSFNETKQAVDDILHSSKYDEETKEQLLKERLKAVKIEKNSSASTEELEALTAKYETLCEYLGKEQNQNVFSNIHALRDEVTALSEEARQKTMGEYITESIRDIMERIGYDIIGSNTVSSAKHTAQKDYYEFSESSVINVSSNEEGAVLFEVLGKSENGEISPAEKRAVKDDMDKFCPDYNKVKELLSEYDLSVTDERTCEADERYVRAVSEEFLSNTEKRRNKKTRRMTFDE